MGPQVFVRASTPPVNTKKPAARTRVPAQATGLITEVNTGSIRIRVLKKKRCTVELNAQKNTAAFEGTAASLGRCLMATPARDN
jgi:hypothetical protein